MVDCIDSLYFELAATHVIQLVAFATRVNVAGKLVVGGPGSGFVFGGLSFV